MLVTFVPMILIFYFILIRPQRKKDKEKREMLASLKVGDKIVTIGGIVGQIARIKDDRVFVETGSNTEKQLILLERWAISTVEKPISD
ncbi:MAG: preprotein translocase subunit YajC [Clostridia bacterium]|nr:preprotein translocase subunit YajC [Clostridia bacterium]